MKRLLRCALLAAQLAACHHESAGQAQAKALLDRGVAAYQKADYAAAWPLSALGVPPPGIACGYPEGSYALLIKGLSLVGKGRPSDDPGPG